MDLPALIVLHSQQFTPPEGFTPNMQLVLRWIHFLAGITWVGLLYFFNLVNAPVLKEAHAATRSKIVILLMPRALWWFRWASVVTVLAGIWYWMMIVSADAHNAQTNGGRAIGTFLVLWTAAIIVEMAMRRGPVDAFRKGPVVSVSMGVVVTLAAYSDLALSSHGWESNQLLAIGIGGGLGWFIMLNVWRIISRVQKRIIRWTE